MIWGLYGTTTDYMPVAHRDSMAGRPEENISFLHSTSLKLCLKYCGYFWLSTSGGMWIYRVVSSKDSEAQLFSLKAVQRGAKAIYHLCMIRIDTGGKEVIRKLDCKGTNYPERMHNFHP